jgi:hypothetical protein
MLGSAPELTGMDTGPASDAFGRWPAAMLGCLAVPERALVWQVLCRGQNEPVSGFLGHSAVHLGKLDHVWRSCPVSPKAAKVSP